MEDSLAHSTLAPSNPTGPTPFIVEFLTSCGTNFLQVGIFFYTQKRFGWTLRDNFLLAAIQGVAYVLGAMNAERLTRRLAPRVAITWVYAAMAILALSGAIFPYSFVLATILPLYAGCGALGWPILESIVSTGVEASALASRIALYNLLWSGAGALILAINGLVIEKFQGGVFALPAIFHGTSMALMRFNTRTRNPEPNTHPLESDPSPSSQQHPQPHSALGSTSLTAGGPPPSILPPVPPTTSPASFIPHPSSIILSSHPNPEPELLRLRTAALWLSRVALPATYVLIYSLMALMPSLPVFRHVGTAQQTLIGSTWMATRLLTFIALGFGTWWHTRPRILIVAAFLMLIAFLGVVIRPYDLAPSLGHSLDIPSMILWQMLLGIALGMIYSASLYFGMVLSEGSTEHGGYHEALIGLGSILGPGSGAIAQWLYPNNVQAGIIAVGAVVTASVAAVGVTALLLKSSDATSETRVTKSE